MLTNDEEKDVLFRRVTNAIFYRFKSQNFEFDFFFCITGYKTNIIASSNLSLELYSKIRQPLFLRLVFPKHFFCPTVTAGSH